MAAGAVIHARERVLEWSPIAGGGVRVKTDRGAYEAGRLVLSPGAWIGDLVPSLRTGSPSRSGRYWAGSSRGGTGEVRSRGGLSRPQRDGSGGALLPAATIHGVPGLKIGLYHHFQEQGHADGLSSAR